MSAGRLRAAVVGAGMIGSLHARIYRDDPRTELVAVVDRDLERARAVAAQLGATAYPDVPAMLAAGPIDLASIATPEQARLEATRPCAEAGVHLLLEKPLAPTLEEVDELLGVVRRSGVTAAVNFILRAEPRYARARAAVADGSLGEASSIFARRRGTALGAEIYGPWSDLITSTAIHDLDAMAWVYGSEVERVTAEGVSNRSAAHGKDDAVGAVLRFRNGAVGILETSWVVPASAPAPLDVSFHVLGTEGAVLIDGADHGVTVLDGERTTRPDLAHWPETQDGAVGGALRGSVAAFVDAVLGRRPPLVSLDEARHAHAVAHAVLRSLRDGVPVTLDPTNGDD